MGRPFLAPGASTGSAMRPGRNGGSGRHLGRWWRLSNSLPMVEGVGSNDEPGPRCRFRAVPRMLAGACVPVLEPGSDDRAEAGHQCRTMTPNALI
jgi:hypothetical protein